MRPTTRPLGSRTLRAAARGALLAAAVAAAACRHGALPARPGTIMAEPPAPFTAPVPPMRLPARLVIYGDSRPKIALEFWRPDASAPRRAVIERIAAERPALVVHSGDLVRVGGSAAEWRGFDREMAPIRDAGIPFFPALGNHEYVGDPADATANF